MRLRAILFFVPIFLATFIIIPQAQSQSDYEQTVEAFFNNDFSKCLDMCNKAISNPAITDKQDYYAMKVFLLDAFGYKDEYLKTMQTITSLPDNYELILMGFFDGKYSAYTDYLNERMNKAYENLLNNPKTSVYSKAIANERSCELNINIKDKKKASEYYNKLGLIKNWQGVGPFENISESGYNKDFGALNHPESTYLFKNNSDFDVKWFKLIPSKFNVWTFFDNYFDIDNSIIYAQSFVSVDNDVECQVRFGVSGSFKVWVNDKLAMQEAEERNTGLDTYVSNVILRKGWNRILVQVGCSEIANSNFSLRIVDKNGNAINNLQSIETPQQYAKEAKFEFQQQENEISTAFKKQLVFKNKYINNLLYIGFLIWEQRYTEARKLSKEILDKYPNSAIATVSNMNIYRIMGNSTIHSQEREKIISKFPDFPLTLLAKYLDAMDEEKYDEAEEYLAKYEKVYNCKEELIVLKMNLASVKSNNESVFKMVEDGLKEFPDNQTLISMKLKIDKELKQDKNKFIKEIEKLVEKSYSYKSLYSLLYFYKIFGDNDKYIDLLEEVSNEYPEKSESYTDFYYHYFNIREYNKALEYIDKALEHSPNISYLFLMKAKVYKEMENKEKALENYKYAIKLNPFDYEAREEMRILENKPEVFKDFTEPNYQKIIDENKNKKYSKDDDAVVLHEETQTVLFGAGALIKKNYIVFKLLTSESLDMFNEYSVDGYTNQFVEINKAQVYKKNGEKLDGEISGTDIVFTNLEIGDAIAVTTTTKSQKFGNISNYFFDYEFYQSSFKIVKKVSSILMVDPNENINIKWAYKSYEPKIEMIDNMKKMTWTFENIEEVKEEEWTPSYVDLIDFVNYSSLNDWSVISKWYYDIAYNKAKSSIEVKDVIAEIFPSGVPSDKLAAAKAIYSYIVNNVTYSFVPFRQSGIIPQEAKDVLITKMGDCKDVSTLFVALCREIGIEATWVLVATKEYGKNNLMLPSINFNHCIATTTINNKKYFVELTSNFVPFGQITLSLDGASALEINAEGAKELTELNQNYSVLPQVLVRNINVEFDQDNMLINNNTFEKGTFSVGTRASYKDLSEEDKEKSLLTELSEMFTDFSMSDLKFSDDLENLSDSLNYSYKVTISNPFTKISNLYAFKIPFFDELEGLTVIATPKRVYPIDLSDWYYKGDLIYNINIIIPDNMKLSSIPKNISFNNSFGNYDLTFETKGNQLKVTRKINFKQTTIKPEEYLQFKELMNKIIKAETEQIAFTDKPAGKTKKK